MKCHSPFFLEKEENYLSFAESAKRVLKENYKLERIPDDWKTGNSNDRKLAIQMRGNKQFCCLLLPGLDTLSIPTVSYKTTV